MFTNDALDPLSHMQISGRKQNAICQIKTVIASFG